MGLIMDHTDPIEDKSPSDETELLLRFVAHRDQACPKCDYNLRNLTRPICPECGEELKLTVGRRKFRDSLLFLALAPCIFSGICTILLNGLIVFVSYRSGDSPPPWVWGIDAFGVASGIAGVLLFVKRRAFTKLDRGAQLFWALLAWAVPIAVFVVLLFSF